jgi:hypothetical protein
MGSALTGDREAGGRREERGWARISSSDEGGREGGKLSTPSGVLASVASGWIPAFRRRRRDGSASDDDDMFESDLVSGPTCQYVYGLHAF